MPRAVHIVSAGVALTLAIILNAMTTSAQTPPPDADLIVTSGEGVLMVAPDRAFVTIAAESRSKSPRDAQRQNAQAMTAVQGRIQALGIAADAVRTSGVDLRPEFDYVSGKQQLRGYVAHNAIEVRLDKIEQVGDVIDASVASGATSVSGVRFDLKDRAGLEREALTRAVADARARADAIAAGAGRAVDRIVRIDESGSAVMPPPVPLMMARGAMAEVASPETPVSAGQVEVRARVTLTARMK
jgi:uncharacterized protein YggE